jgi:hypothetical protein
MMKIARQWALPLVVAGAVALGGCGGSTQGAGPVSPTVGTAATEPATGGASPTPNISPLPTPGVAESPLASPGARATDVAELKAALSAAGATVQMGDKVEQPFFEVQGQELKVNGQTVQVFEWADEASRQAVSGTITPEGQFGAAMIEWVGTPHFWASGKLIALYVGDDASVVSLLTSALGAPIAG